MVGAARSRNQRFTSGPSASVRCDRASSTERSWWLPLSWNDPKAALLSGERFFWSVGSNAAEAVMITCLP